jgi:hypothetical protein
MVQQLWRAADHGRPTQLPREASRSDLMFHVRHQRRGRLHMAGDDQGRKALGGLCSPRPPHERGGPSIDMHGRRAVGSRMVVSVKRAELWGGRLTDLTPLCAKAQINVCVPVRADLP